MRDLLSFFPELGSWESVVERELNLPDAFNFYFSRRHVFTESREDAKIQHHFLLLPIFLSYQLKVQQVKNTHLW